MQTNPPEAAKTPPTAHAPGEGAATVRPLNGGNQSPSRYRPLQRRQSCATLLHMIAHHFALNGQPLAALPSGALFWPAQNLLCVSDLHLGKSERLARRGGALLPPYEVTDTLTRLDADIAATQPATVICLGDSFDDPTAATRLDESHRIWLLRLMAGRNWIWIAGNHDPAPPGFGGIDKAQLVLGGLTFRHIAEPAAFGEISGHYHPKTRLQSRSRPCFLLGQNRLILPAYGTYTGGLWCDDPAFSGLLTAPARAILTGTKAIAIPLPSPRIQARK